MKKRKKKSAMLLQCIVVVLIGAVVSACENNGFVDCLDGCTGDSTPTTGDGNDKPTPTNGGVATCTTRAFTLSFRSNICGGNVTTGIYYKLSTAGSYTQAGSDGGCNISRMITLNCGKTYDLAFVIGGTGTNICSLRNGVAVDANTTITVPRSFSSNSCPANLMEDPPTTVSPPTSGGIRTCFRDSRCPNNGPWYPGTGSSCYRSKGECEHPDFCFNDSTTGCDTSGSWTCGDANFCASSRASCLGLSGCSRTLDVQTRNSENIDLADPMLDDNIESTLKSKKSFVIIERQ